MNKLFSIYMCALLIIISIVLPFILPAVAIVEYVKQGFSGSFIAVLIITIFAEPLTIGILYVVLTRIKDIYNDLSM